MHDLHIADHPLFNEGYLGPFDVQRDDIKANYLTLAMTHVL